MTSILPIRRTHSPPPNAPPPPTTATAIPPYFPRIFDLPAEIRLLIWDYIIQPTPTNKVSWVDSDWFALEEIDPDDDAAAADPDGIHLSYKWDLALLAVNRQVYAEASARFWRRHVFVRIDSPWPDAERHIALQGHVPLVATGQRAQRFCNVHMEVSIAPAYFPLATEPCSIIMLERDLAAFGAMWFHSHLTYPGLNAHLRLTFRLSEPHAHPARQQEQDDDGRLNNRLQRRLLTPFSAVKDLNAVCFEGDISADTEMPVRIAMALPPPDPEECLHRAATLLAEGDTATKQSRFRDAVRAYERSFGAIFIVSRGRRRTVWAEAYFQGTMRTGAHAGMSQNIVRLILRTELVAGMVRAHRMLGAHAESRFWGMRTIRLMREHMGVTDDEAVLDFVAADAMGRIYHGTGLACRDMGDAAEALTLLRVAAKYLPKDEQVQKDYGAMREWSLKVGADGERCGKPVGLGAPNA